MNPISLLFYYLRRTLNAISAFVARKWRTGFYLYLAGLFTAVAIADTAFLHFTANMKQGAFDMMVRYRLAVPKPDKDIVIVDINEASLAAMSRDYGRWPWPRQVLGEFVEQIEKQHPKAIVFDILFSDPDVFNADSDAYFDAAIAGTNNTFFPMLRLDPADDKLSQVKAGMIPGVVALGGEAEEGETQPDATVAVVLPYFNSVMQGGRIGLHNIYPDADSITRQYPVYRDDYGWKMPSLPLRIAQELKYPQPATKQMLLNWRGKPFTYHSVSFSDVFTDLSSKTHKRPADEFTGKIVIIGSTAPSLFDIKATPLSQLHPGVEILATAIDNFKHGDYLRFPDARVIYFLLTLAFIWATAWVFYRNVGRDKIDRLFGMSQFILIGISYASINLSTTYIDLTGPVTLGLAYFTVARLYSLATGKALEESAVRAAQLRPGDMQGVLMLIRINSQAAAMNDKVRERVRLAVEKSGTVARSVDIIKGLQRGVWGLFEDTLAISWLYPPGDEEMREKITRDIEAAEKTIVPLLRKYCAISEKDVAYFVHEGIIAGGDKAPASWRALFATATLRWDESRGNKS
jgi:CHASE2 domain-containing sensor protein